MKLVVLGGNGSNELLDVIEVNKVCGTVGNVFPPISWKDGENPFSKSATFGDCLFDKMRILYRLSVHHAPTREMRQQSNEPFVWTFLRHAFFVTFTSLSK